MLAYGFTLWLPTALKGMERSVNSWWSNQWNALPDDHEKVGIWYITRRSDKYNQGTTAACRDSHRIMRYRVVSRSLCSALLLLGADSAVPVCRPDNGDACAAGLRPADGNSTTKKAVLRWPSSAHAATLLVSLADRLLPAT